MPFELIRLRLIRGFFSAKTLFENKENRRNFKQSCPFGVSKFDFSFIEREEIKKADLKEEGKVILP